ncbi:hypothetical protein RI129_009245 [Pyrocoelia pectoralis]|uniref:Transmembrane protein 186 n=1 Tax=Pyrocoelia pectoralis TaxID=417401 RepID=A0AAN7V821_9COLE
MTRSLNSTIQVNENLEKYTPIYKFSYIRGVSMINRLKFYHSAVSVVTVPSSLVLYALNLVNSDIVLTTIGIAISGCAFFYSMGCVTNNIIGIMYVNDNKTTLKIAYTDFWGRRKDVQIPMKDNVPSSDIPTSFTDNFYWKFKNLSVPHTLKISTKYGDVFDKEMFYKIFSKDIY